MTVGDLRGRMSHGEYVAWGAYHARQSQRHELAEKMAKRR